MSSTHPPPLGAQPQDPPTHEPPTPRPVSSTAWAHQARVWPTCEARPLPLPSALLDPDRESLPSSSRLTRLQPRDGWTSSSPRRRQSSPEMRIVALPFSLSLLPSSLSLTISLSLSVFAHRTRHHGLKLATAARSFPRRAATSTPAGSRTPIIRSAHSRPPRYAPPSSARRPPPPSSLPRPREVEMKTTSTLTPRLDRFIAGPWCSPNQIAPVLRRPGTEPSRFPEVILMSFVCFKHHICILYLL